MKYNKVEQGVDERQIQIQLMMGRLFFICLVEADAKDELTIISIGFDRRKNSWCSGYVGNKNPIFCYGLNLTCMQNTKLPVVTEITGDWADSISMAQGISYLCEAANPRRPIEDGNMSVEVFVTDDESDFANFGGPLEYEFACDYMQKNDKADAGMEDAENV